MKSQTNSSHNNNNFTPSLQGPSECHIGKSINPNNYYFNSSGKPQHQRSLANLPPQLSARNSNSSCINSSNNNNPNILNNNCNGSNSNFHSDTKNFNDASFLTAYQHHSLSPMEGLKSANNNNNNNNSINNNNNHHNTPLGSKNYNNNTTTTTTTTATVPNMLLVRPANNPSSLHIGTFPFLPVQFF